VIYFVLLGAMKGAIFALAGWGFSIILGILGIVNFSHGIFFILGGYLTFTFAKAGLNPWLAILAASSLVSVYALAIQHFFINRVMARSHMMVLVLTLGLAIVARETMGLVFGFNERLLVVEGVNERTIALFGNEFPLLEGGAFFLSAAVFGFFFFLFRSTALGLRLRAIGENTEVSRILGINVRQNYVFAMLLCGFWTGLAGGLAVFVIPMDLHQDVYWTVMCFLVVVVGGTGNLIGTFIAAILIGVILFMSSIYARGYSDSILYVLLFLLMLVKPTGLFPSKMIVEERK
jgi:branched-chain amino acid transport system permease protein